ncbi:MAG: hypothetical protein GXO55_00085 [Chloroflexi bacterium]|nr:hypothetical protein [Chloroflexota bacterium]
MRGISLLLLIIHLILSPKLIAPTAKGLFGEPEKPGSRTENPWIRSNPGGGGWFNTVKAGPDGMILAASDLSGFYRSQDGGRTWDVIGATQGLKTTHASAIGFHPTAPHIILLGTEEGIYRSTDRGEHVAQVLDSGYITDIALSPANPDIGYAAWHSEWDLATGQIYRTTDSGQTWSRVSQNLPHGLRILKIALDPHDTNTLYLLSGEGRFAAGPKVVYRSTDGGLHWTRIASNLGDVMDVATAPDISGRVYITTYDADPDGPGDLFRSDNRGRTWSHIARRGGRIWLVPGRPQIIRLIDPFHQFPWDDRNGVWESVDGGHTWKRVSRVDDWDTGWTHAYWAYNSEVQAIGEDLSDPKRLYMATSQFIFTTDNEGRHFYNIYTEEVAPGRWQSRGVDNVVMFGMAISEVEPWHIYLGYFDIGCWHSPDNGVSWENCNDLASTGDWEGNGGNTTTLLADPHRRGVVWTAQAPSWDEAGTLLRSTNYGKQWTAARGLPPAPLMGLSLDRTSAENRRTLFITAQGDVYRSTDDGATWQRVFPCGGCRFTAVDPFDGSLVYAGGEKGLWRSTAGGRPGTWEEVGLPEMRGRVRGDVWEYGWEGVFAIAPSPHRRGTVYVAALGEGKGLYRSEDAGRTWRKLWTDDFMRDVAISPRDPNLLVAASSSAYMAGGYDEGSHGILISLDRGRTWRAWNEGMAWPFALTVTFQPHRDTVWAGVPGPGFQKRLLTRHEYYIPYWLAADEPAIDPLVQNPNRRSQAVCQKSIVTWRK